MTKREFLKLMGIGVTMMSLPTNLFADDEDYKAIVILYQGGGNDSLNMFVPLSKYEIYSEIRENLKISNEELDLEVNDDKLDLTTNPYEVDSQDFKESYLKGVYKNDDFSIGVNPLMPEMAHLLNQNKLAIIFNMGNLIMPSTKSELDIGEKPTPPFLFAHNHQTKLMMNGEAGNLDYSGWAGRVADELKGINNNSIYGMNISLKGTTHIFEANNNYLVLNPKRPTKYIRVKRDVYDSYLNINKTNSFENLYNEMRKHSFELQDILGDDWENNSPTWDNTNAYDKTLFELPDNETLSNDGKVTLNDRLLVQLKAVAKWAYIGKNKGLKRQIFFVEHSGYDTHSNQLYQHSKLLRELSMGIGDFNLALQEMEMENDVTLFNVSEFSRSSGDNGDGTDHAWGGSYFVMGGAVKGGEYGKMPDLNLGSDDDFSHKGRLIPTISFSQYYATTLKWFGLNDETINKILPELKNFSEKDLGFMNS